MSQLFRCEMGTNGHRYVLVPITHGRAIFVRPDGIDLSDETLREWAKREHPATKSGLEWSAPHG